MTASMMIDNDDNGLMLAKVLMIPTIIWRPISCCWSKKASIIIDKELEIFGETLVGDGNCEATIEVGFAHHRHFR
jgi:hypothetical protein